MLGQLHREIPPPVIHFFCIIWGEVFAESVSWSEFQCVAEESLSVFFSSGRVPGRAYGRLLSVDPEEEEVFSHRGIFSAFRIELYVRLLGKKC